ncbi:DNA repair protein RecN [Sphingobacterium spiritivorum]|uniref:DNA repair protein RecN n=1 Tax=Sphingobacterium spiritivorum ATCC 33861 TaxID=525373 RepID=D7VP58_SPHSI|nr:DNA repair protein RecN [Sphingobacterium spiritivorum]EFK57705.1 DNA repair protein RecN [Sphingobacterium spiritivorum ATCC 33861]QQT36259.1 DNA repair protein RecN [Sphingobacterium spiritivorum]WQD32997.1 DNA repair protein RecN [Sphingobacterium spiritivorum]SUJ18178.1 Recombination protein N [Sphingobacterium spiritivorum]
MLSRLYIRNYALIDTLDISFDKGLNIITGETGAGKSIIMGALSLILGSRIEGKYFFNQDQKCIIEGYFNIGAYHLQSFFDEHDMDYETETIIRREISVDGKSRAFINDSPVNLAILKSLGEQLIDVHSQHATLQINTEAFQLLVIDSIAGNTELKIAFEKTFKEYRATKKKLEELKGAIKNANAELDYHQFLFDELEQANLQDGEQIRLEEEQQQLENAEEIKRGLLSAVNYLTEQEANAVSLIKDALVQLQHIEKYMPASEDLFNRLQSTHIELKDIVNEIEGLEQTVVLDESRLDAVNDRLNIIYTLQKKHRVEQIGELIALRNDLESKIISASSQEELLITLEKQLTSVLQALKDLAGQLSASRQDVLPQIQDHVASVLAEVGMPHARLHIELQSLDETQFKESGQDSVQFLFSANKGQELQPIHKVASGGELSRVMLAIKSLIARSTALPTIIFDEIDTGISGEVALKVGEIMQRLASHMQVLAITHLPQIASKGKSHFKVYKEDSGDKTQSNIVLLNQQERVLEVAQMLSGANPGEAAIKHATELIEG